MRIEPVEQWWCVHCPDNRPPSRKHHWGWRSCRFVSEQSVGFQTWVLVWLPLVLASPSHRWERHLWGIGVNMVLNLAHGISTLFQTSREWAMIRFNKQHMSQAAHPWLLPGASLRPPSVSLSALLPVIPRQWCERETNGSGGLRLTV